MGYMLNASLARVSEEFTYSNAHRRLEIDLRVARTRRREVHHDPRTCALPAREIPSLMWGLDEDVLSECAIRPQSGQVRLELSDFQQQDCGGLGVPLWGPW